MIIKNVKAYTEDKVFHEKDIHIENGLFCTQSSEPEFIDGNGCYAIPGLIDLHYRHLSCHNDAPMRRAYSDPS